MKQMTGLDATFVALEQPDAPMHIGSFVIYDPSTAEGGFVRFKNILEFMEGRLQLAETMRQKMVKVPFSIDYPYWVQDSDFDIEYHVRHVGLPKPGDWRQLCILAARIHARPLDLSRPPWEITVIEGLDNIPGVPKGSYAMLSKVHHSAIDGASGVDIMNAMHTLTPDGGEALPPDTWRPEPNPSQIGTFIRGYGRALLSPLRQANAMRRSLPGMYRAAKGFIKKDYDFKTVWNTPKTRFNGIVSPHRMVDGRTFALKEIKQLRGLAEGSTLNDVMLSITGGAMRRYLEHYDELPDNTVTAMAPINVREESEKNTMGNQVAAMFVPLGSHIESAQERMKYVAEETVKSKALTEAMGARQVSEMVKLAPASMMMPGANLASRLKLADYMKPTFNTVVTNVPGPPIPIYSAGAKMVNIFGLFCLADGIRLGHVVHSYMDKVTLTFTACRTAVPNPDFYAQCIQDSFDAHIEALAAKEAAKPIKPIKPAKPTKPVKPAKPTAAKRVSGAKSSKAEVVKTKTEKTKTEKTHVKPPAVH